jgi:hypothetical protein
MTAVKSVSAKPLTGFEKKKTLEHYGFTFEKREEAGAQVWVAIFEGEVVAKSRLQIDCVQQSIDALGGE